MPEDQERCDVPHCTCPPEDPLHIPAGTVSGAIEAITHRATQQISEGLIQPPSNGPLIAAYLGYTDGQDHGTSADALARRYGGAHVTQMQMAEQWPDMGFDPDSYEPVVWVHDPANVHTTPRMQRAQEVADRLNACHSERSVECSELLYPGGYLSRALDDAEQEAALRRVEQGWVDGIHVSNPQITPLPPLGIPSEPTDTYGYEVGRVSTPESSTLCWADDWSGSGRYGSHECGRMADPDSALGLCTKHEADKQRFNEERGPDPEPAPATDLEEVSGERYAQVLAFDGGWFIWRPQAEYITLEGGTLDLGVIRPAVLTDQLTEVAEREFPYAGMGEVVTGAFRSFIDGMAGIGPQLAEAISSAFSGVSSFVGQAHNRLVRTDGWMEGPGYATSYLTGHRWRDPETGEQWRVAGRRGDKHWIRTGPRRARWWK